VTSPLAGVASNGSFVVSVTSPVAGVVVFAWISASFGYSSDVVIAVGTV
jgi:hypothetical protein